MHRTSHEFLHRHTVPGTNDVVGAAIATNSVTVHPMRYAGGKQFGTQSRKVHKARGCFGSKLSQGVNSVTAYRKGEYYHGLAGANNSSSALWQSVRVSSNSAI